MFYDLYQGLALPKVARMFSLLPKLILFTSLVTSVAANPSERPRHLQRGLVEPGTAAKKRSLRLMCSQATVRREWRKLHTNGLIEYDART